jgi:hypothetical protein
VNSFSLFLLHIKQPEHLHVVLNHWPVEGVGAGIFFLAWGLWAKSLEGRRGALLWLVVMAILTGVAIHFGEKGFDRVYAMSNSDAQAWLDLHATRADRFEFLFTLTGLSALAALIASWKRRSWEKTLSWVTIFLALCSFTAAGWIAQAGGPIRHSEFRDGPPPK